MCPSLPLRQVQEVVHPGVGQYSGRLGVGGTYPVAPSSCRKPGCVLSNSMCTAPPGFQWQDCSLCCGFFWPKRRIVSVNCPPLGVSCTPRMQEVRGTQGPCQRGTAWPVPALRGSQFASWTQPAFVSHETPLAALLGASFLPSLLQSLWATSPHGLLFPESPGVTLCGESVGDAALSHVGGPGVALLPSPHSRSGSSQAFRLSDFTDTSTPPV